MGSIRHQDRQLVIFMKKLSIFLAAMLLANSAFAAESIFCVVTAKGQSRSSFVGVLDTKQHIFVNNEGQSKLINFEKIDLADFLSLGEGFLVSSQIMGASLLISLSEYKVVNLKVDQRLLLSVVGAREGSTILHDHSRGLSVFCKEK